MSPITIAQVIANAIKTLISLDNITKYERDKDSKNVKVNKSIKFHGYVLAFLI